MRRKLIAAIVAATFLVQLAGVASAGPSMCDIMYKIGVRNVRECEDPPR